jgi:hypothetical protein
MAAGYLKSLAPLADDLAEAAQLAARAAARAAKGKFAAARRTKRGAVLRPGPDTPLWNELAGAVQSALRRRGEKAKLARILGLPRQRLHVVLVARTACLDAERTLQLLVWLQARRQGRDLA